MSESAQLMGPGFPTIIRKCTLVMKNSVSVLPQIHTFPLPARHLMEGSGLHLRTFDVIPQRYPLVAAGHCSTAKGHVEAPYTNPYRRTR